MDTLREAKEIKPTHNLDGIDNYRSWVVRMRSFLRKNFAVEKRTVPPTLLLEFDVFEGTTSQVKHLW